MKNLILAHSGFGKTTSLGNVPELGIKGLDPETTFVISTRARGLPFKGSHKDYKVIKTPQEKGNRMITNNPTMIAKILKFLANPNNPIKDVFIDDFNFTMQDYYMKNGLTGGYDAFKTIGKEQYSIYEVMNTAFEGPEKNLWIAAHPEIITEGMREKYIMKTVGKMTRDSITPEGNFDMIFIGMSIWDDLENKIKKVFITNEHELISGAKSWVGMFDSLEIPNDLGYIKDKINAYYQ